MAHSPSYVRPTFDEVERAWKTCLQERGFPTALTWIFDENLCFEKDSGPGGFRLGFQTSLTPPPPQADRIGYKHFAQFEAPIVFYRLGSCREQSICMLLCDTWFAGRGEAEEFFARDPWGVLFRPGTAESIEEITDRERWERRIIRHRPLHDLDFCMSLRAVHETLAHGRVLSTYERSALKVLHIWGRVFGRQH